MNIEIEHLPDPHSHFATFAAEKNQTGEQRAQELRRELFRMASIAMQRPCVGTIEANQEEFIARFQETGELYNYAVSSSLLEVALIACEMVKQEQENQRLSNLG